VIDVVLDLKWRAHGVLAVPGQAWGRCSCVVPLGWEGKREAGKGGLQVQDQMGTQDQEDWQGVEQNEYPLVGQADMLQWAEDLGQWVWQNLACVRHTWGVQR
jgi:hypothetical protein